MLFPLTGLLFSIYVHGLFFISFRSVLKLCHYFGGASFTGLLLKITTSQIHLLHPHQFCLLYFSL